MNGATFDLDEPPPKIKINRPKYNGISSSLSTLRDGLSKEKFILSRDTLRTENDEKKYSKEFFHLNTIPNVKKALETDDNLYEVLWSSIRKLYYDFDDIEYTHEEADKFITYFKTLLEDELNITINDKEYIVLKNENKTKSGEATDKIHSLHIIITNYKSNIKDQMKIARYLNAKYDIAIDENVYKSNNQFRLINQSKLINGCILVNYYNDEINIKKSLINITDKCKSVEFNKVYDIIEYYKDQQDNKPLQEITEDELLDFALGNLNKEATFDINKFFNDNHDWKATTNIICKLELGFYGNSKQFKFDIIEWNKQSVRLGNNEKYTYERNKNFIDKIDVEVVRSGIPMLCKIISKYSSHNIYTTPSIIKENTLKLLRKYYDDDTIIKIKEQILVIKKTKQIDENEKTKLKQIVLHNFITIDNIETQVNVKTGFINFKDKRSPINMFYDELPPIIENMFQNVETIIEAKEQTIKFLDSNKKLLCLKSRWGTGKTSNIIKYILDKYKNKRILLITESTTLNNKLTEDFKEFGFVSHLQTQKDPTILLYSYERVICSIQSIQKVRQNTYDIVIIDEFESVFSSYTATKTFLSANTSNERAFNTLMNCLKRSNKVLITDCDISEDKLNILKHEFDEKDMMIIKNNEKAFQMFKLNIMTDRNQAIDTLTHLLYDENKKIAVPSATKKLIQQIEKAILTMEQKNTEAPKIKILVIHQENVMIIQDGVKTEYDKEETLKDVEPFIIKHNIQLFLYSPTIKTGVSINSSYFDITFGFASSYSILYNEFIQMLFRQRRLNDNKVFICIQEQEFANNRRNKHIDVVKRNQHIYRNHYKHLFKDGDLIIYDEDDVSVGYYEAQSINNKNATNSRYNYAFNFFQLIQYHNLKYEYTISSSYKEQQTEINNYNIDIVEATELLYIESLENWINTELLTYKHYNKIFSIPKNNRYDDLSKEETLRYNKTITIYSLLNVKKSLKRSLKAIKNIGTIDYTQFDNDDLTDLQLTDLQAEQIETTIQHILKDNGFNNKCFYDKYIKDKHDENIDCIYNLYNNIKTYYTATDEDDKMFQKAHSEKLLKYLGLYDNKTKIFKPKKYTNKQFKLFIIEYLDYFKSLYTTIVKKDVVLDVKNKLHIKTIYHKIKKILLYIDIHINYDDQKNTSRDYDTFSITNIRPPHNQIYKYKSHKTSDTLSTLYNNTNTTPIKYILNDDADDYYTLEEINKRLKKVKITKKEASKIQHSLFYHRTITTNYHDISILWSKPSYKNKKEEYEIIKKEIIINEAFYNPLLDMKTIDNKIMMNKKLYEIDNKKDNYSFVIDKGKHKSVKLYKYKTKTRTYYKPYNSEIPTIITASNEHYDKTISNKNDDDIKIDIEHITNEFNDKTKYRRQKTINKKELNINKKEWFKWILEITGKEPHDQYVGYNFYDENKEQYLYWDIQHLDINKPLMDEIKQQNQISVLGY